MKKKIVNVLRIILGLILFVVGLNKFLNFFGMPEMPEEAQQFMAALVETGYMMPMIAIVEILVGALLLANLLVPVALVILVPLTINIVLFHLFLDPGNMFLGLLLALLNFSLMVVYRKPYYPMTAAN